MMKRKTIMISTVLAVVSVFIFVTASYSGLTMSYQSIIRVAYMNGFMEAVKMDPAELKKIRDESSLLQETVEEAAERYVEKVDEMTSNKEGLKWAFKGATF